MGAEFLQKRDALRVAGRGDQRGKDQRAVCAVQDARIVGS